MNEKSEINGLLDKPTINRSDFFWGSLKHSSIWLTSPSVDIIHQNPRHKKSESTDAPTIVIYCVHGTADRPLAFDLLARALLDALPANIASIRLVSFDNRGTGIGIEDFAEQLKAKILEAGDKDVYLMGHSRGGLVCSYFAENIAPQLAEKINIHGIFTIGTPFGGCDNALPPLTWLSKSVSQMQPDSKWLARLNQKVAQSAIPYYFYAGELDSVVTKKKQTYVSGFCANFTLLRGHGHLSMLSMLKDNVLVESITNRLLNKPEPDLSIHSAVEEIRGYLAEFKNRWHILSSKPKIDVLTLLCNYLEEYESNPQQSRYPEAKTISAFIIYFLLDKRIDALNIIDKPLNIIQVTNDTATWSFIDGLLIRYHQTALDKINYTHSVDDEKGHEIKPGY